MGEVGEVGDVGVVGGGVVELDEPPLQPFKPSTTTRPSITSSPPRMRIRRRNTKHPSRPALNTTKPVRPKPPETGGATEGDASPAMGEDERVFRFEVVQAVLEVKIVIAAVTAVFGAGLNVEGVQV